MSNVILTSRTPKFQISMDETVHGHAVSSRVQININDKVVDQVVTANTFHNGVIDVVVAEGFRIVSGVWAIDQTEHYSGNGTPFGTILKQVVPFFIINSDDSRKGSFVIKAGEIVDHLGDNNPSINQINGTIIAVFTVVYTAI